MARMERSCFACISCRRVGWASATVGGRRRNVKACGRTAMRGSREDHTDTARRISNAQQTHQPHQETHLEHQAHTFISRFRMCRRTAPRGELYKTRQSNTKRSETGWEQPKTTSNVARPAETNQKQQKTRRDQPTPCPDHTKRSGADREKPRPAQKHKKLYKTQRGQPRPAKKTLRFC